MVTDNIKKARKVPYKEYRIGFTKRQNQIARKSQYQTHEKISKDLNISKNTVNNHITNINNIVNKYPQITNTMVKNLHTLNKQDKIIQMARTLESISKEYENINITVELNE